MPARRQVREFLAGAFGGDKGKKGDGSEEEHVPEADDRDPGKARATLHARNHGREGIGEHPGDYERTNDPAGQPQDDDCA